VCALSRSIREKPELWEKFKNNEIKYGMGSRGPKATGRTTVGGGQAADEGNGMCSLQCGSSGPSFVLNLATRRSTIFLEDTRC
jgi:hypothetical protein